MTAPSERAALSRELADFLIELSIALHKHAMYPAKDPVRPEDLAATIFHLLGLDPHTEVNDTLNRPRPIAEGSVVTGVIA